MRHVSPVRFVHRFNPDGSIDSICTNCFATIATDQSEVRLGDREQAHTCDGYTPFCSSLEYAQIARQSRLGSLFRSNR